MRLRTECDELVVLLFSSSCLLSLLAVGWTFFSWLSVSSSMTSSPSFSSSSSPLSSSSFLSSASSVVVFLCFGVV